MKLLIEFVSLGILVTWASALDCDPECQNKYTRCGNKVNWYEQDCSRDKVRDNCALMCGTCVPCGKTDGKYGKWEKVLTCSKNCVEGDVEISVRECNDPPPMNGGSYCEGSPIRVKECEGCAKPVSVDDLDQACSNNCDNSGSQGGSGGWSGMHSAAGYPMSCSADIEQYDSDGYRLVFRHTGNEISISDFYNFYRTGVLESHIRNGCPGSQYRDPNLHFFWGDATDIVLDIFDTNYNRVAYVTFALPQGYGNRPTFDGIYDWDFVTSSLDQHYSDIRSAPKMETGFEQPFAHRNLYLASSHAGCENDHIWFTVGDNNGVCWWDKVYGRPSFGPEKTTILYSPFKTVAHTYTSLSVASKFELRMDGKFADTAQNGYKRVMRYPNAAGVDFMDFFERGVTDSYQDRYTARAGEVKADLFRSNSFESDISSADKVLVVVYDTRGNVAESLSFMGSGNMFNWFSKGNLISSLRWKLQDDDFNFFSVEGDGKVGRRFFMSTSYWGCPNDAGYLVVSCMPTDENSWDYCGWEDFSGGEKENRDQLCAIFYTPGDKATKWNSDYMIGSAIEIFVK